MAPPRFKGNPADEDGPRLPTGPPPAVVALVMVAALGALVVVLWASRQSGPSVVEPDAVEAPGLSDDGLAPAAGPEGSLEALVPGIPPNLRLVVPAAGGAAELLDWPTFAPAPIPNAAFQQSEGWLSLHAGGLWAAETNFGGSLFLGTVFRRVFHGTAVHSLVWHAGAATRLAWLSQPPDRTAELWTASLSSFSVDSRRVAEVPQLNLGSAEIGDGGFLVAFGDWGYVIERALPTERIGDVTLPHSQVMAVDADGVGGPWRDGRLIAAAPDGRLLVGIVNVLSGTYSLEMTGPDLMGGTPQAWVSIGHTMWSPTGAHLFNMIDFGPPTARFSIIGDEDQRFRIDAQFVNPLGWSADGRYFLLGAIVAEGRQLVIVDVEAGTLAMAPIERLPRYVGLG